MKKSSYLLIINLSLFITVSCISIRNTPQKLIEPLYNAAVADAAYPSSAEIAALTIISKANQKLKWKTINNKKHLLVATWTSEKNTSFYPKEGLYNTKNYPIWVTAIPDLQERCDALKVKRSKNPTLRVKQLLGLPSTADKSHFIEFWVQSEHLFRPCPDNEIDDERCDLCFPNVDDETAKTYKTWVNQLRLDSYYNCKGDKYPWTQLGYTYDWHPRNKKHIGISEFVIKSNSDIYINKITPTKEYLDL